VRFYKADAIVPLWERITQIVSENWGVNKDQITGSTSFLEDIGSDSLDVVELVMELEEEFQITIPNEQAEKIKTVGDALDYIERHRSKWPPRTQQ
jgi:acyl carrier protein